MALPVSPMLGYVDLSKLAGYFVYTCFCVVWMSVFVCLEHVGFSQDALKTMG